LGRDAACHSIALALGRNDILKDVILTNTNYFSQALWMWALPNRTFSLNFAWYSQNNFPVVYRDDFIDAPISNLKFVSADIHWVWTCSFQRYLKQYVCAGARFNVVGPIIWRLRGKSLNVVERELMVAVFDVTPVDSMTENRLGLLRNYYSEENVSKFILDILGAVERVKSRIGKDIRVVLKHKRSHVSIHSKSYISLINGLVLNRKMEIFEPNGNIYNLLESCTAAVVLPFSSPAYVAQAVGKSAFWYDPLEKVLPLPFEDKIELIGGEKNLEVALSRVILD
jgi:polysaccharide biosynthesis PFTS motif protein